MNTKSFFWFLFLLSSVCFGQAKPQKKVLLTLSPGEVLYENELYLMSKVVNEEKMVFVTTDAESNYWLYFNGQRIQLNLLKDLSYGFFNISELDFSRKDGFGFEYFGEDKNGQYVCMANYRGKLYGPYESIYSYPSSANKSELVIEYENEGNRYRIENGVTKGPIETLDDSSIGTGQGWEYRWDNGQSNVYKNGVKITDGITNHSASISGEYFAYIKEGKIFVNNVFTNKTIPADIRYPYMVINNRGELAVGYSIDHNTQSNWVLYKDKKLGPFHNSTIYFNRNEELELFYSLNGIRYKQNGDQATELVAFNRAYFGEESPLKSKDGKHSFYWTMDGLVIDGNLLRDIHSIQNWYNPSTNAFQWTSLEENQIVLYTYTLN
jgi:hypothetical protein